MGHRPQKQKNNSITNRFDIASGQFKHFKIFFVADQSKKTTNSNSTVEFLQSKKQQKMKGIK
jgi:hypothetical protein